MSKSPRYGQYDLTLSGFENCFARLLVLPDVPVTPEDQFLARAYARAQKPSTVTNMYSRWLNSAGQQLCKGKLAPVDGPVGIHIIASTGHCPAAICALISRLAEVVITDVQNIEYWSFEVEPDPEAVEPRVMIVVQPKGTSEPVGVNVPRQQYENLSRTTRAELLEMFPD